VYAEKIKGLVREKGLEHKIHFYGERPYSDIAEILREHDLFINISRTGSLDKAVLEAMACGLTVLTSNEAYRTVLPPAYFLEHVSPEFIVERIKALADEPRPNQALRGIVTRDHALERTVDRLFSLVSGRV
jgi:glycosyltransferase involved in cell wall biosynthesis